MKRLKIIELKEFLDEKTENFNRPSFIKDDPISIPHRFSLKQDVEIAGFLTATISWGQRPVILKNASSLLMRMDNAPYAFIMNFSENDLLPFKNFVHRTFNGTDCSFFLKSLQNIYRHNQSLESLFLSSFKPQVHTDYRESINSFRKMFFSFPHPSRSGKHFANPEDGSAAKRINMFLRWMIRKDSAGVDFGIWNLSPSFLTCPLDVHSGRVARRLNLLKRKQNDWTAAAELTNSLKKFDEFDPVKYDFALFGLGVFEKF